MTLNEYQREAMKTITYPSPKGKEYCIMGLTGEAGEVANKYKKYIRGDSSFEDIRKLVQAEIGDVLWYVAILSFEFGFKLDEIAESNLSKLAKRQMEDKLKGSGDTR